MAAETLTSVQAGANFPVAGSGPARNVKVAWGTYAVAAVMEDGDIFEMHWVPDGATVVGGYTRSGDLDTGIEQGDTDLGWAANSSDAADADGLGDHGVWVGAANLPHAGVLLTAGPKTFTSGGGPTKIQLENNVAQATFAAGTMSVVTYYHVP